MTTQPPNLDSASNDHDLAAMEEQLENMSSGHRIWVLPMLLALDELGGSAKPKDVEMRIRDIVREHVNDGQFARVLKGKHIRWARFAMKESGLVGGARGTWELTDRGGFYLDAHRQDSLVFPEMTELDEEEVGKLGAPPEVVAVTDYGGYDIPILQLLVDGVSDKQALLDQLEARLADKLLPGDKRVMPMGLRVVRYRASWALSTLKGKGESRNIGRATWEATETGKQRLELEKASWDITRHQRSKARVRALSSAGNGGGGIKPPLPPPPDWKRLRLRLPAALYSALDGRLRPDLGPSPGQVFPRNAILYGPPGTGKTFRAKQVARALTGSEEPGPDSPWRLVQFHPSYSYEDFVQGLKPDLEHASMRYQLGKGPFLQICEQAEQEPDRFYVLIIDEINRGDPARIFGELLYALEYREQPVDLALGGQLSVPSNLVVIGTMNSVDRSVALVDYALRRRFGFVRVDPSPEVLLEVRGTQAFASVAARALGRFNEWLANQLDREHTLGHSFFLNPAIPLDDRGALQTVWNNDVRPLLEEYFFADLARLGEAAQQWKAAIAAAETEDAEDASPVDGEDE